MEGAKSSVTATPMSVHFVSFLPQFCQVCHTAESESLLLLCDACDKGTHTYCCKVYNSQRITWFSLEMTYFVVQQLAQCFRAKIKAGEQLVTWSLFFPRLTSTRTFPPLQPKLDSIPDGDWYCTECVINVSAEQLSTR